MKSKIMFVLLCFFTLQASATQTGGLVTEIQKTDPEMNWIENAKKVKDGMVEYRMQDCPVVGNLESGIYHTPGNASYKRMLVVNKCVGQKKCSDNRRCFDSVQEARAAFVKACPLSEDGKAIASCDKKVMRHFVPARF